jgi:hypothetical protein
MKVFIGRAEKEFAGGQKKFLPKMENILSEERKNFVLMTVIC